MILSLILYGSRARGDFRAQSDVDLLGIVEQGAIRSGPAIQNTSLHLFPFNVMLSKAQGGDLFISHVLKEGKVLHDSIGMFEQVKSQFKWKSSYADEREQAVLICRFIISNPTCLTRRQLRKRLVWSLRTMIISSAAEKRCAVFGANDLEKWSSIRGLKKLIDNKFTIEIEEAISISRSVLRKFDDTNWSINWPIGKIAQISLLQERGGICESSASLVFPSLSSMAVGSDIVYDGG